MNSLCQRQLVGLFGFAVVAVWFALGTFDTLLCLLVGAGCYVMAARLQERRRDRRADEYFQRAERRAREATPEQRARLARASSA
jgi:hypothetical protein